MQYSVEHTVVEGNGVWLAHRVTLPNGAYLKGSNLIVGAGSPPADEKCFEVYLSKTTPVGGGRLKHRLATVNQVSSGMSNYLFDDLQFTYWDGYDDIGYNLHFFVPASGTDLDGQPYSLDGANDYVVEFELITNAAVGIGSIRWQDILHVTGLVTY